MRRALLCAAVAALVLAAPAAAGFPAQWEAAADRLDMPVLAPTTTYGLALRSVKPEFPDCGSIKEQLKAVYLKRGVARVEIYEGKPQYCGDLGDNPLVKRVKVHGHTASIFEWGGELSYAMAWSERGIGITILSSGLTVAKLVRLARSMIPVEG